MNVPNPRQRRPGGRLPGVARAAGLLGAFAFAALSPVLALAAEAQGTMPPAPAPASGAHVLELEEAIRLSRGEQPSLAAFEREAAASEQAALAAHVLPDPQISAGIQNLPVTGDMAFDPVGDGMTMYTIGIMREQVRRSRREAEAARLQAEAVVSRAEGSARERSIERDVLVAWIDAVEAVARQRLIARVINDLEAGRRIMEAGVPTGASTPALALQAQAEIALAEAQRSEAEGDEARARAALSRWIGPAAWRPLPESVPRIALSVSAAEAVRLDAHPQVRLAEAQEQAARRQIEAARAERRPNISWSVMYGWRPEYGDMVSAQVSIPLQMNRRRLQDRRVTEAEERAEAARLRAEDARRELGGSYRGALANYRSAEAQLAILREQAIPSLEAAFEAAEARYAGGQGSLELPLNIVRRYVEANIQAVEQQGRLARAAAELIYLTGEAGR